MCKNVSFYDDDDDYNIYIHTNDSNEQLLTFNIANDCMEPILFGNCVNKLNDNCNSTISRNDDNNFGTFLKFRYVKSNVRFPFLIAFTISTYA